MNTNIAAAYAERAMGGESPVPPSPLVSSQGEVLVREPWEVGRGADGPLPVAGPPPPEDMVRVAMLRVAGIADTVALGDALGFAPARVAALECLDGFELCKKRIALAAGLGSWRSKVEAVVATGMLPSGTVAGEATQAKFLDGLFDREEPKRSEDGARNNVVVISGDGMARILGALAEAQTIEVPVVESRTVVPATDAELDRRRAEWAAETK